MNNPDGKQDYVMSAAYRKTRNQWLKMSHSISEQEIKTAEPVKLEKIKTVDQIQTNSVLTQTSQSIWICVRQFKPELSVFK